MIARNTLGPRGRRLVIAAGLAAGAFLAGCDGETATSRAVDQSQMQMLAVTSGEVLTPASVRNDVYQKVLSNLRPVADAGTSSQNAAAALLMSQAQAGLAEGPLGEAAELEAISLHALTEIRSMLSQWLVMSAAAEAAGSFDPGPELNSIQTQVRDRQRVITEAEATRTQVEARVADLRRQSQTKSEQARSLQQEAARLRQQVANQTAVQGEQTLTKAREISRRADALEVESAELEARAEQIEPEVVDARTRVEGIRDQLKRLEEATAEVQARAARARDEASRARAEAAKVAQEIHAAFGRLAELRSGELAQRYQAASSGFESAAATARRALSENRVAANMLIGSAQQSLGDLHWSRAHGLGFYHETLEALVQAQPPLPQAQQYRQQAQQVAEARREAMNAATEAYSAAHAAYGMAGSHDRLARVANALNEVVNKTSDGKRDLGRTESPGASESLGMYEAAPATGGGSTQPGATPQETLERFAAAMAESNPEVINLMYFETPDQRDAFAQILGIFPAMQRLTEAMEAQFGDEADEMLGMFKNQAPGMGDLASFDIASVDVDVSGDIAEAHMGDGESVQLRRVDGAWLVDLSEMLSGGELEGAVEMLPKIITAIEACAEEIEMGKYRTAPEAFQALMLRMMTAGGMGR